MTSAFIDKILISVLTAGVVALGGKLFVLPVLEHRIAQNEIAFAQSAEADKSISAKLDALILEMTDDRYRRSDQERFIRDDFVPVRDRTLENQRDIEYLERQHQ